MVIRRTDTNELTLKRDHEIVTDCGYVRIRATSAIECTVGRQKIGVIGQIVLDESFLVPRTRLNVAEASTSGPVDAVVE
jgi:hypothetical protein